MKPNGALLIGIWILATAAAAAICALLGIQKFDSRMVSLVLIAVGCTTFGISFVVPRRSPATRKLLLMLAAATVIGGAIIYLVA